MKKKTSKRHIEICDDVIMHMFFFCTCHNNDLTLRRGGGVGFQNQDPAAKPSLNSIKANQSY